MNVIHFELSHQYSINFDPDSVRYNYPEVKIVIFKLTRHLGEREKDKDILRKLSNELRNSRVMNHFQFSYLYHTFRTDFSQVKAMFAFDFRCLFNSNSLKKIDLEVEKLSKTQKKILWLCVSDIGTLRFFSLLLVHDINSLGLHLMHHDLNNENLKITLHSSQTPKKLIWDEIFYISYRKSIFKLISANLEVFEEENGR